jgi:hypothetical protein
MEEGMPIESVRAAKEGLGFGLIAGLIFAMMQGTVAVLAGGTAVTPLRMFASVMLGEGAMGAAPIATVLVAGGLAHFILSGLFGVAYGLANSTFSRPTQTGWSEQLGLGLLFGAALWVVNFELVARALYPWLLARSQPAQLLLHAVCFGLPLALMMAGAERRAEQPLERGSMA